MDPIAKTALAALTTENVIREIYGDLLKPGVTQIGHAIGGILGLGNTALWHIHLLNGRAKASLEANLDSYRRKLEANKNEDIAPVPPEIGVPILERFTYVSDERLRELYTQLLATASIHKTQHLAHPSFATILANITPDECVILEYLKANNRIAFQVVKSHGLHTVAFSNHVTERVTFPYNLQAYVSNLEGHGVLKLSSEEIASSPPAAREDYSSEEYALLTDFGQMFLSAVLPKENS